MADYIICKYFERFALIVPGVPDSWPQYLKISVVSVRENYRYVNRFRTKHIDRHEAQRLIREGGLTEVLNTKDGKVWDTPDKSFQERYRGLPIPTVV